MEVMGRREMRRSLWWGNLEERTREKEGELEDLDVDGRIISK